MNIFRFEMKQYRSSIIVWSIGLIAAIILLLPMFVAFTGNPSATESLRDNPILDGMGISPDIFFTSTGIFAYLHGIILVAAAIQACNLGLSIITKEHMQNTADFLITKPYSRASIFFSKLFASLCVIAIIGLSYFLGSLMTISVVSEQGFTFNHFFLIYLTFPLIQLFFLLLGMTISVVVSRVSATLPLSFGIAFGLYVIGLFSNVVQSTVARLISPFRYFDFNLVIESEYYEGSYLTLFFALLLLFVITSYIVYIKKDMKMVL
ncbi:ABC transporter permease [Oceanobacillus jeddahense]|uniref:ABC transporter permease n=1 Tax=Oceanobacillus jeddahense TaxID=1462527 RepID=UPI003633937E